MYAKGNNVLVPKYNKMAMVSKSPGAKISQIPKIHRVKMSLVPKGPRAEMSLVPKCLRCQNICTEMSHAKISDTKI